MRREKSLYRLVHLLGKDIGAKALEQHARGCEQAFSTFTDIRDEQ